MIAPFVMLLTVKNPDMPTKKRKMKEEPYNPLTATYGLKHKAGNFVWAGRFKPHKVGGKGGWYWNDCNDKGPIEGSMNSRLVRVTIRETK